jgi:glycosyltransferase involved in cell wall biosynthesis
MRVVFVNRFFFPDISATSQMLSDLAFFISQKGHDVTVITSRQLYEAPHARLPKSEIVNGVKVIRVASTNFGRKNLLGRAFDYFSFYFSAAMALWRQASPNTIVVAKTDPPLISVPAALVSKARGAILVNWMQDLFPEVAQALGVHALQGIGGRIARALRNWSLRSGAMTVMLGERMQEMVLRLGLPPDKVRVIPNWADGSAICPLARGVSRFTDAWRLEHKFVVCYSGNLGRAHEFQTVLEAAAIIAKEEATSPRTVFLFIGGGAQRGPVEERVRRFGLGNVRFAEYQPRDLLGASLAVGDVHLVTLLPNVEGFIVPSKIYGVMAAGRPVLFVGDRDGELARIIAKHRFGHSVTPGAVTELVQLLAQLRDSPEACALMGQRARAAFEAEFAAPIAMNSHLQLLISLGA